MKNEITIKIILEENNIIDEKLYMDIINGLNDRYVPVNEITLNGDLVFTNTDGFIKNKGVVELNEENKM